MISPIKYNDNYNIIFSSATTDSKWFEWIEEQFNVSSSQGRKITFEQFKETLHLEKVTVFLVCNQSLDIEKTKVFGGHVGRKQSHKQKKLMKFFC